MCFIILDGADTSNLEATKIITKKIIIGIDSLPRNPKIPKEGLRLVFNLRGEKDNNKKDNNGDCYLAQERQNSKKRSSSCFKS